MDLQEFTQLIRTGLNEPDFVSEDQINQLYVYMNLVLEKNKVMNLTSITDPKEFVTKHIIDSLSAAVYVKDHQKIIDIGTGAGFPGVPLKVIYPNKEMAYMDSVKKKIDFIECCTQQLGLSNNLFIHQRAEDAGQNPSYRGRFDCGIARAVAYLPVLLEYCLPLIKKGGIFISMKGGNIEEELDACHNALSVLKSSLIHKSVFCLSNTDISRSILIFKVNGTIPSKYPRKAGLPTKKSL